MASSAAVVVPLRPAPVTPAPAAAPESPQSPVPAPEAAPTHPHRARWIWGVLGVLTIAVVGWTLVRPWLLGPLVVPSPVVQADFVRTLVASGHVATLYRSEIGVLTSGIVERIPVREGQTVRAGDTLIVLDDTESMALAQQAAGQLRQVDAQIRQQRELTLPSARTILTQARARLLSMEQTYARNLAAQGYDTPASHDEALKNVDVARADVRAAELTVFTNQSGGSSFTVLQTQRAQAAATLSAARTRVGYRAILAPRAGVLISRSVEVGDVAQPGATLMLLSPSGAVRIELQIDERNLGQLALGQAAIISADAFPTQRFAGTVSFINPGVDLLRASVKVRIAVPLPPAYLRQDMTVSVDVETARHPGAIVVDAAFITDPGTATAWVLVARDGHARRQAVTTGLVAGGKAEILSGLVVGDQLVASAPGGIRDGDRLRLSPVTTPP